MPLAWRASALPRARHSMHGLCRQTHPARPTVASQGTCHDVKGAALLRRGVFALFMGLFARGCVSPVLISGGQQPSQRVPASFRRPAEPRNGTEHRRSVPLGRAPFWTFARRSGTVPWEGRQTCDGCDDRIPGTYIRRAANWRPLHRSPEPSPVRSGRCCLRGCQSLPLVQRSPADERERTRTGTAPAGPAPPKAKVADSLGKSGEPPGTRTPNPQIKRTKSGCPVVTAGVRNGLFLEEIATFRFQGCPEIARASAP